MVARSDLIGNLVLMPSNIHGSEPAPGTRSGKVSGQQNKAQRRAKPKPRRLRPRRCASARDQARRAGKRRDAFELGGVEPWLRLAVKRLAVNVERAGHNAARYAEIGQDLNQVADREGHVQLGFKSIWSFCQTLY